jgi:hypothetical protein
VLISAVVLQIVESMMIPDPWFDYDSFIALGSALEKLLDSWGNLLVDQVIQVPEVVLVVR